MTTKQNEVKQEIGKIWEILTLAKECFHYSFYLYKPNTEEESKYIESSFDLKFIRHILWRMTVIEIAKLFNSSKRDRFSLIHFISKLNKAGHFGNMGINNETVAKWEISLNSNKNTINNVLTLRDKIYAHTDSRKENYKSIDITFQEVGKLVELAEEIIKEIYSVVFSSNLDMEIFFNKDRFDIIKILSREREKNGFKKYLKKEMPLKNSF